MNSAPPFPVDQGAAALADKHILVIDDDEPMLRAVSKVLGRAGAAVKSASSTVQAMAWLADTDTAFDAVVTDLRMPVTSGKFILSVIKTMHPEIPVLIMSAYWTPGMKEECSQLGVAQCLDKPLNAAHLLESVSRALGRPPREGGAPGH